MIGRGRIEVQAHEQVRVMRFRHRDAVRERHIRVVRAGEKNRPTAGGKQIAEPTRPVEREFFFRAPVNRNRAAVDAAVAGVNDDGAV